ncbi:MAG: DNA polymerase IV [Gammaproteobacteria bacterium]|nr:DNA polymerase IV [Gammaproteobacteria bacterium]
MIIHVDMDAFYASVEERERPEIAGHPVIVGGAPDKRGVVSAANYNARQFGVHSAMPTAQAVKLCPHAILLPGNMALYSHVSRQIRSVFERYTPLVEPLSLDEAFLDVDASRRLHGNAEEIGKKIKQDIKAELALVASVGVAPNKFLAKIASDIKKPDGFVVVDAEKIQAFLDPLPVNRLWGVGKSTLKHLNKLNVFNIKDIRQLPQSFLQRQLGKHGLHLWELAQGIDARPVVTNHQAKSISNERTFEKDIEDKKVLRAHLLQLVEQVSWRLRQGNLVCRVVRIKIRLSNFKTITRSVTLTDPTQSTQNIWKAAATLLDKFVSENIGPIRLVGFGASDLDHPAPQQGLFSDSIEPQRKIDCVADQINKRFGAAALRRGTFIKVSR